MGISKSDLKYALSFKYSILFWLVVILDILVSLVLLNALIGYFLGSSEMYHHPLILFISFFSPFNILVDVMLVYNARKSPDSIDIRLSWIKSLFGFLGGYTSFSGLYFVINSFRMQTVYNAQLSQ
jgi:hypothetical protein